MMLDGMQTSAPCGGGLGLSAQLRGQGVGSRFRAKKETQWFRILFSAFRMCLPNVFRVSVACPRNV